MNSFYLLFPDDIVFLCHEKSSVVKQSPLAFDSNKLNGPHKCIIGPDKDSLCT